jgi:hypothetical protein
MTAPLYRANTSSPNRQPEPLANKPTVGSVVHLRFKPREAPDRKLRNRIILAIAAVWIVVITALAAVLM